VFIKKDGALSQPLQIVCVSYSVSISTLAAFIIKVRARLRAGNSPTKTNNSLAPPSQKIPYSSPKKKNPRSDQKKKKELFFRPTLRCVCSVAARTARLLLTVHGGVVQDLRGGPRRLPTARALCSAPRALGRCSSCVFVVVSLTNLTLCVLYAAYTQAPSSLLSRSN
jgi:hypothetical protein